MTKTYAAGLLLCAASLMLYVAAAGAFVAMLQALTVSSTITAIESAFGTFVLGILLLVFARRSWLAGKTRIKSTN